jgi:5-(carboxyamino)imidazole ribonucleotide synthase
VLHGPDDVDAAWRDLQPKPLVVESRVDLRRELSIIIARGADGSTRTFDITTNHHVDHILDTTRVPSDLGDAATLHIIDIAETMARDIGLVGIMAIELFEDQDGNILVNEIAPRPHNSGHWTMDACAHSQFDLQIRAVVGMPLPDTRRHSDAVMRNLLGQEGMDEWPKLVAEPWVIAHWYGKAAALPGRKMGHVTTLFPRDSLRCMGC